MEVAATPLLHGRSAVATAALPADETIMAPRSSWKGFLQLSLVSVPVKAFTAHETGAEIRLNQLHKDCHSRVRYKKVCQEHGELASDEIVSGYEYAKDQYVVIDGSELSKIRKQSDRSVKLSGFVKPDEIRSVYLAGKTYYLMPDGVAGQRPYALLRDGMRDGDVVGVAQVVLSGREQLVMIHVQDDLLVMSVLHYAKKIKGMELFAEELAEQEASAEERKLTDTLIEASILSDFDLSSFEDDYVENLGKLIQMKVDGQEIVEAPDREEPKIINLMEALKKSVAEAQASGARKMAPSVKKKTKKAGKSASKKSTSRKKKTG